MATIPFRGLSEKGVLNDPQDAELDLDAWSQGMNVRFHANAAERAPVWRAVGTLASPPAFCVGRRPTTGFDKIVIANEDGTLSSYTSGAVTDVTPSGFTPGTDTRAFTSTFLGDVTYINRPDKVPAYYGPSSTIFAALPGWDATWRCRSLRAFGDYLVALNVTKGATTVSSLVKWSDLTLAGLPPGSWDSTDPTTNAGENPLEGLTAPLVDGCTLRDTLMLYTRNEVWAMQPSATNLIFAFSRVFGDGGMIAPNCAVEVNGKNYVFGPADIYVHDGVSKQSIVDKRNKDYIFRYLNVGEAESCFVAHLPTLSAILFACPWGGADTAFQRTTRCNLGALYDYVADTWTFIDLPNVGGSSQANLSSVASYATTALTYTNSGGSYFDQDAGVDTHIVAVSQTGDQAGTVTAHRLIAYDFLTKGSLAFPFLNELNGPVVLERTGIDLDQVGADLGSYKLVRRVFPLVTSFNNTPITVQVGGAIYQASPVTWSDPVSFDPTTQYKVDVVRGGRFLAIRFNVSGPADFSLAGFDADIIPGGRR